MHTQNIREHVDVFGSCSTKFGTVDRVEGNLIKLTRDTSGQHHFIPMEWVDHVVQALRLNKGCGEAKTEWSNAPVGTA